MLQNDYLLAKIGVDTAENEPRKESCGRGDVAQELVREQTQPAARWAAQRAARRAAAPSSAVPWTGPQQPPRFHQAEAVVATCAEAGEEPPPFFSEEKKKQNIPPPKKEKLQIFSYTALSSS